MTDRTVDTSNFVVMGEGLAAGVGHFSLSEDVQPWSFPALLARGLGTPLAQPVLEAPGLGNLYARPVRVVAPDLLQTTIRKDFPGDPLGNLAVPGFTARDALTMRPLAPLVHPDDAKQTLVNFILGLPGLTEVEGALPTQLEAVQERDATLTLVELGFHELLELCVQGYLHSGERMDLPTFREDYAAILAGLGGKVIVTTVPDPFDTAYFSSLTTAAEILRTESEFLRQQYELKADDFITLPGLVDIGYQLTGRQITGHLEDGSIVSAASATKICRAAARMNADIRELGAEHGALVYDLNGFMRRIADDGIEVDDRHLSGDFLGGFYLLNGIYPGRTGHALIANDILAFLDRETGSLYEGVDVSEIMSEDGNTLSKLAPGPRYTDEFLEPRTRAEIPEFPPADPDMIHVFPPYVPGKLNIFPIQTGYPEFDPTGRKACCKPIVGFPAGGLSEPRLDAALVLPEGLEQTLEINKRWSYFGDALRAVDAPDDEPFLAPFPPFGASGNTLFGGLAITDSHLDGKVHIKFSEPDERNITRFEVYHPGGLVGDDGALAAPLFFKLPSQLNTVLDVPGLASWGELNLDTGLVTNFHYNVIFMNTAIMTLFGVNPNLPAGPMQFPGPPNAGHSWAKFEQRADGRLDFTCAGNTFLPLGIEFGGDMIRFPLPFSTPDLKCASVAARCTTLHPHIHISTRDQAEPTPEQVPEIPVNTVQELTTFVRNTTFGDVFGLNIDELEGEGTGRCHLMGRLKIQFGPRFGDSVGFAMSFLPPGGLVSEYPKALDYLPPGTSRGMVGFNEQLTFPSGVTYNQSKLSCASDPNRTSLGAIDLATGQVIGEYLYPGFVVQQLFVNLIDVEPCTPADAFNYQGPAVFESGPHGEAIFRFNGEVYIPYPRGFNFPSPNEGGRPPFKVVRDSRLDPFLRLRAMHGGEPGHGVLKGGRKKARSSIGQEFSYRFSLSLDPDEPGGEFEYSNLTEGGTFTMTSLTYFSATYSRGARTAAGAKDTVTFGCFGRWSEDEDLHQASVHISTNPDQPYVGIQVDGGLTSNVNTKPKEIEDSMP